MMAATGLAASVLRPGAVPHSLPLSRQAVSVGCKRPAGMRYARVGAVRTPHQRRTVWNAAQLDEAAEIVEGDLEEIFEEEDDGTGLSTQQVQSVLHVLCEETEVAELELKMGSFEMRVRRSSRGAGGAPGGGITLYANGSYTNGASPIPIPPPGTAFASTASMDLGPGGVDPAGTPSPAVATVDEDFDDESTIFLTAPKVGVMRRGRYVKGKKVGKGNIANVGDEVKKGQPLGFIEQLGTYVPVESPQAGEIVAFVADEGTAVEYAQPIVEIVPFFGGHIIGDRKHA